MSQKRKSLQFFDSIPSDDLEIKIQNENNQNELLDDSQTIEFIFSDEVSVKDKEKKVKKELVKGKYTLEVKNNGNENIRFYFYFKGKKNLLNEKRIKPKDVRNEKFF